MSGNHKGYVGIYEFARATNHSVKHIYEQIRLGKIPAKKLGRKWQIKKEVLESALGE